MEDVIEYIKFKEKLKKLNITQKKFAEIIEYNDSTIRKWSKKGEVPKFVEIILEYFEELKEKNEIAKKYNIK